MLQGTCRNNVCVCTPGFSGTYCEVPPTCGVINDINGNCCKNGVVSQAGICCGPVGHFLQPAFRHDSVYSQRGTLPLPVFLFLSIRLFTRATTFGLAQCVACNAVLHFANRLTGCDALCLLTPIMLQRLLPQLLHIPFAHRQSASCRSGD